MTTPTFREALHASILASMTNDPALYRQAAALYRALDMPCSAAAQTTSFDFAKGVIEWLTNWI